MNSAELSDFRLCSRLKKISFFKMQTRCKGAVHILRNTNLGFREAPPLCNIVINWGDHPPRLYICQKNYTTEDFRVKNLHRKRVIFDIC